MGIKQKIRTFIDDHLGTHKEEVDLKDEDNIFKLGFVDSLFAMQLIGFVEEEFDIELSNNDLDLANFSSIERIAKFVQEKKKMDECDEQKS